MDVMKGEQSYRKRKTTDEMKGTVRRKEGEK